MMGVQSRFIVILAVFGLVISVASAASINKDLVNEEVDRHVSLQTQVAETRLKITVKNTGSSAASTYHVATRSAGTSRVAFIGASQGETPLAVARDGDNAFAIELASPIAAGSSEDITIRLIETHVAEAYPTKVSQADAQSMRSYGSHFFYSPYKTETQKTKITTPSASIHSQTDRKPTSVKGDTITYGPYKNVAAREVSETAIHYEAAIPFLTATTLVKEIEISHWGNVAIEEHYTIRHDGAELKQGYSRYDFQRNPAAASGVVKSFSGDLPVGATEGYYRDIVGNVSTSRWREEDDGSVNLELTPRFPMYGGWKTQFYYGYNLPTANYLKVSQETGELVLSMDFGTVFDSVIVDDFELRVILPEGSKNIKSEFPFLVDSQEFTVRKTYLDVAGRPVLVVKVSNVVGAHRVPFAVRYSFSTISMLNEPLLVIGAFFSFFLLCIVYARFDLSLKTRSASEEKAAVILSGLAGHHERREQIYADLAAASGDTSAARKAASASIDDINTAFGEGVKALNDIDSTLAAQVKDLVRAEKERHRALISAAEARSRHAAGQLTDSAFSDAESTALRQATSFANEANTIFTQNILPALE